MHTYTTYTTHAAEPARFRTCAGRLLYLLCHSVCLQILLLTSALGMSCAIGHGAGHELIHSRNLLYQAAVAQQMAWSMLWVYTK